jgi:hypothetical protein
MGNNTIRGFPKLNPVITAQYISSLTLGTMYNFCTEAKFLVLWRYLKSAMKEGLKQRKEIDTEGYVKPPP